VQVDVYAPTEIEAEEISEKIRLAPLSGYSGLMNETVVLICTIQSERAVIVQPVDSSGRAGWRRSTDYRITYEREVVAF